MTTPIHCDTCLRSEERDATGAVLRVLTEGGQRRPAAHRAKAAWQSLNSCPNDRALIGPCDACGQPLFAPKGQQPEQRSFTIQTPKGPLRWGPTVTGPDGPMSITEAENWLNAAIAEPPVSPLLLAFQTLSMSTLVVPLIMWCFAVFIAFWFLYHAAVGNVFEYLN